MYSKKQVPAFFTERERPDETAMHKRRIVFSRVCTVTGAKTLIKFVKKILVFKWMTCYYILVCK